MIVRSPEPPIGIPDVPLTRLLLERAESFGDKPALIDGPSGRAYTYRAVGGGRAGRGGRSGPARAREGRRAGDLQPEPAGVRDRVPRGLADRRHRHHHQPALHDGRAVATSSRTRARGTWSRCRPFLDKAREAAARVRAARGVRLRRGGRRHAVRVAARRPGARFPTCAIDPGEDLVALPVLERHHRPAQGRDAHPPQPGREHPAVRGGVRRALGRRSTPGRPAVLPHLRHGRDHEPGPLHGRDRRHAAALRSRVVPADAPDATASPTRTWCRRSCSPWPSTRWSTSTTSAACASIFSGAAPLGAELAAAASARLGVRGDRRATG